MRLLRLLLPDLAAVTRRSRRVVAAAAGLMFALLAANLAHTQFGLGGEALEKPLNAWGQNVVLACACVIVAVRVLTGGPPGSRPLLAAIAVWTLGNLWWGFVLYDLEAPPFPSPADAGWLAFYPFAYLCLGLRLRASARDLPRSAWLDGLIGILSVGALGVTLVVAPVLAGAEGTRAAVLTNAAYPLADLLLLALAIAVLVLHGWRAGRAWALLAAGFGLFALADSIYLARLAADTYSAGTVLDSLWVVALVIMALASWQPLERPREVDPGHLGVLVPPFVFSARGAGAARLRRARARSGGRRRARRRQPSWPRWRARRSPCARSAASTRRAARRRPTSSPSCPTAASSATSCAPTWRARVNAASRWRC